jgi:hypothetical protein
MGQYIANVGPQHTFVVPTGVLNPHGANTLAIAVTSDGGAGNGLEQVALTNIATVRGGVAVPVDESPGYLSPRLHVPDQLLGGRSVDATVADLQVPADAQATALQAKIAWGDGTSSDATVAGGAVSGQHTYARPGAYRLTVTVADRYGGATLADAAGWLIAR